MEQSVLTELYQVKVLVDFPLLGSKEPVTASYYLLPSGAPIVFSFAFEEPHLEHANELMQATFNRVHPNLDKPERDKLEKDFIGSWYTPIINQITKHINDTRQTNV